MVRLNNFQFKVEIGDHEAEEHDIRIDPANTLTCYVEAVAGAFFRLRFEIDRDFDFDCYKLTCKIWIDSDERPDARIVVTKEEFELTPGRLLYIRDVAIINYKYEAFQFKHLAIREMQAGETIDPEELRKYSHLGTIRAEVYKSKQTDTRTENQKAFYRHGDWVRYWPARPSRDRTQRYKPRDKLRDLDKDFDKKKGLREDSEAVPEKALKGRSLNISAGFRKRKVLPIKDQSSSPPPNGASRKVLHKPRGSSRSTGVNEWEMHGFQVPVYREDEEPIAKFIMKYRTRKGLQDEYIIVPPDDDEDSQNQPEEYRRRLLRRREEVRREREQRKQERLAIESRYSNSGYNTNGFALIRAGPKKWYGSARNDKKIELIDLRSEDES